MTCPTTFSIDESIVDDSVKKALDKDRPEKSIDIESQDNDVFRGSPFTKDFKVWIFIVVFIF